MPCRNLSVVLTCAAMLWTLADTGRAQQTFRAGVSLVVVDMRVLKGKEQVTDLRPDEVTLLVDGRPRPIVSLVFDRAATHTSPEPLAFARDAPRGVPTVAAGRRVVLVVDRGSFNPGEGQGARKSAQSFLDHLSDGDAVAVATLPISDRVRFGLDRRALAYALEQAFEGAHRRTPGGTKDLAAQDCSGPAPPPGCESAGIPLGTDAARLRRMDATATAEVQEGALLRDLQWLLTVLAAMDGPTDVVLINGGLPANARLQPQVQRLIGTASLARVRVHVLEIANTSEWVPQQAVPQEVDSQSIPVQTPTGYGLALETGGIEATRSASGGDFFKQLERELAGSYLLSFEPLASERDGKPHSIQIRISRRPQPTIHARKAFMLGVRLTSSEAVAAARPQDGVSGTANATTAKSPESAATLLTPPTAAAEPAAAPAAATMTTSALRELLERAAAYVERFERIFSTVVAEERYVQVEKIGTGAMPTPGDEPALAWRSGAEIAQPAGVLRRRQLLSDVLLVQGTDKIWLGYRDVAEVDGKPVRDRTPRVQKLFLSTRKADRQQLQRIADESARLNIGADRNVNTPTFPLQVLRASFLKRFGVTGYREDRQDADCCTVIGFRETASPTLVHRQNGADLPMTGELWIEPHTGRIRRAVLQFAAPMEGVLSALDVTYRPTSSLDVLVPDRLWEWVLTPDPLRVGRHAFVEGQAWYGNLRRFSVSTEETIK